jgi:glycine/D-amino acid oxidase-like deaminating enzyme
MENELLEPPASIVIIGAGPVGLEAALYARTMGYRVTVIDRGARVGGEVCSVAAGSTQRPFRLGCSRLGLAALRTQDPSYAPPAMEEVLDGDTYLRRYLEPLSHVDLLADAVRLNCQVRQVLRNAEYDSAPEDDDEHCEFIVEVEGPAGVERLPADAVLDVGGATIERPNYWGELGGVWDSKAGTPAREEGGLPPDDAIGPADCRDIRTSTPYFYVLGGRSWGPGHKRFLIHGLDQICRLFAMFSERPEFDLYRSVR